MIMHEMKNHITRFTGIIWETGNSLVITIPKKQTSMKKGDQVMIELIKMTEVEE